jgi:hypothetical protein
MLPRRWTRLARHGLLGTSLLGLAAAPAAADPCDDYADRTVALVIGVDVAPKLSLIGGIEGRACVSDEAEVMLRLELGGGGIRVIGGGRARPFESTVRDNELELLGIEAGGAIDLRGNLGAHLAATYGTHSAYLALQALFPLSSQTPQATRTSLVAGFAPWTAFGPTVVEGRPLVHGGRIVQPDVIGALAALRSAEDRAVRDHFVGSARAEYSSVWTFLRLAAELAAVGAPATLIARALVAADDEVGHAELCADAAGGLALAQLPMWTAQPRFTRRSCEALAILAVEAWCEGCLNEGAAANEARFAAAEAQDERAAMLAAIARDEAGHAELSWDVLAWIHAAAPDVVRSALAGVPPLPALTVTANDPALARRGVPSSQLTAAARADAAARATLRLRALVA